MFICILDNLQTRFYIDLHVKIKEITEGVAGLYPYYKRLHNFVLYLRKKYKDEFFTLMKDWDAYAIGHIISDDVDGMGFVTLRNSLNFYKNLKR